MRWAPGAKGEDDSMTCFVWLNHHLWKKGLDSTSRVREQICFEALNWPIQKEETQVSEVRRGKTES